MKHGWASGMALALLNGCATLPAIDAELANRNWQAHRENLSRVASFDLRGRVASSGLGLKADLRWAQQADGHFNVQVTGPLGSGALRLRGDKNLIEITSRDGSFMTEEPEQWLQDHYGWTLPISHLRWWALGLPAPQSHASLRVDEAGLVAELRQDGWLLSYSEYQDAGNQRLPRRFDASNGELNLRVLADRWDFADVP